MRWLRFGTLTQVYLTSYMSVHSSSFFITCQNGVVKCCITFILMYQIGLEWISSLNTWGQRRTGQQLFFDTLGLLYVHWKLLKAKTGDTSSKLSLEFGSRRSKLANNEPLNTRERSKSCHHLLGQVTDNSSWKWQGVGLVDITFLCIHENCLTAILGVHLIDLQSL